MLRTIGTNISIITNFGCRAACWYCIWKGHELEHVQLKTDWEKLENFLCIHADKGKVSISGGGDSLYKYDEHHDWWEKLLELTNKYRMKVDVHTREKFYHKDFWTKFINRCVFSSDVFYSDKEYLEYLSSLVKVRVTHLVTAETSDSLIEQYLEFSQKTGSQFTIKELVKYDDKGKYKEIREKYKNIFYLDRGDYNTYYMPDNSIRTSFLEKGLTTFSDFGIL